MAKFYVLSIGTVNTTTGKNADFGTVWGCWEENHFAENALVQFDNGRLMILHSAGRGCFSDGDTVEVFHDQSRRRIGFAKIERVEPHTAVGLMNLGAAAGKRSIVMATLK